MKSKEENSSKNSASEIEGERAGGKGGMGPRGLKPIFYQTCCFHFLPLLSYSPQIWTKRAEKNTVGVVLPKNKEYR